MTHQLHEDSSTVADGQRRGDENEGKLESPSEIAVSQRLDCQHTIRPNKTETDGLRKVLVIAFPRAHIQGISTLKPNTKLLPYHYTPQLPIKETL